VKPFYCCRHRLGCGELFLQQLSFV
jgi:hypothetical protein